MKLIFVRHAESQANKDGILAGRLPKIGLSDTGMQQALRLKKSFEMLDFDSIYTSPIQRCLDTARMVFGDERELIHASELMEMDFGDWSGQKLSELTKLKEWEVVQRDPARFAFPNGESFTQLRDRVDLALSNIQASQQKDSRIVIFTHADVVKMVVCHLLDAPLSKFQSIIVNPASLTLIDIDQDKLKIAGVNLQPDIEILSDWTKK
jgi:probable phosphoglycerate mutase